MPSDKPDDDMSNPAFSPRQLEQLDQRDEKRGFSAIQLEQLDQRFETCGFNARQLQQLDARFAQQDERMDARFAQQDARSAALAKTIVEDTSRALGVVADGIVADIQGMLAAYLEDRDRRDRAVSDATETRLAKLEEAELLKRVGKLEAAVFPSKPQRRRRG